MLLVEYGSFHIRVSDLVATSNIQLNTKGNGIHTSSVFRASENGAVFLHCCQNVARFTAYPPESRISDVAQPLVSNVCLKPDEDPLYRGHYIKCNTERSLKNAVFWDVTPFRTDVLEEHIA
jgi:hypothetical protein